MPGRIIDICVKVGDKVSRGQTIAILEAMKMENNIPTDFAGTVKQILVEIGEAIPAGGDIIEVE